MTAAVDIVNRALQCLGTRTTVTQAELDNFSSNEAIQANLIYDQLRRGLLRMAPWDCATNYAYLNYITSLPGTPENPTAGTSTWVKGQPAPPWLYEYQYPFDCLKALWIVPQSATGFDGDVPITSAVTGIPAYFSGPPQRFKISVDQFYSVTAAAVAAGGTGHAIGDYITLAGTPTGSTPIGAPAVVQVITVAGSAVATVAPISTVFGETMSGSYITKPTNPVAQASTTGSGTGATFNLTLAADAFLPTVPIKTDQRVILTNQEQAVLCYVRNVTDINVMDPAFLDAWTTILGARLVFALTGDKALANIKIAEANMYVAQARKDDANEGITVNDVTPDWIRQRGIYLPSQFGFGTQYDWGGLFPMYG